MLQLPGSKVLHDAMISVLSKHPQGMKTTEIDDAVAEFLGLSQEQKALIRQGNRTELSYRLAWERTHAKRAGEIVRIGARTWKLSCSGGSKIG